MIDRIKILIYKTYHLKDKIAFYPSIIALFGILASYLMFYLESLGLTKYLLEYIPEIIVNNTDTARTLLTTFIAGLISIMVFSFSMVMILLNKASSNFSPRLLPGLISNRRHQIILGFYIGTIIYSIIILVSIEENGNEYQLPGSSVLVGILLMIHCLAAFIYFIHSISQEIQIDHIMNKIFFKANYRLQSLIDSEKEHNETSFTDTSNFKSYPINTSGYVTNIGLNQLAMIAKKNDFKIKTEVIKGIFVLKGETVFKADKELDDKTIKKIIEQFNFSDNDLVEDNYVLAFKQLTEIAVKAMSPGINDPGTALNAIDYLSQLFCLRLEKKDLSYTFIEKTAYVNIKTINFETLIYQVMASLRTYCKQDITVVQKLIKMLHFLKNKTDNDTYKSALDKELMLLKTDIEESITNQQDLTYLQELFA